MTTRNPLVIIGGVVQELPASDSIAGVAGGGTTANVISVPTTLAADVSMVVVGYFEVADTFDNAGNVEVL